MLLLKELMQESQSRLGYDYCRRRWLVSAQHITTSLAMTYLVDRCRSSTSTAHPGNGIPYPRAQDPASSPAISPRGPEPFTSAHWVRKGR